MSRRVLAFVCALLAAPSSAAAAGPQLSVPPAALNASLQCTGDLASRTPVLVVPGTGEDPDFFDWNYLPALRQLGQPYCTVTLPFHGTGDIQVAAEYVVHAIRTMSTRAGNRRISVLGHSQGGMVPRWALKWWPETRMMVDDLIGLASSNHGTTGAQAACSAGCNAAAQQQKNTSKFIAALNAGAETWAGISYTSVFTRYDEIVTPNQDAATGSTALRTGDGRISNVAVQDLCPADTSEHLDLGSRNPVGYALFLDAITNDGPADPKRFDPAVCAQPFMPGVNPATYAADSTGAYAKVGRQFVSGSPAVSEEPPLACYAGGPCASGTSPQPTSIAGPPKTAVPASKLVVAARPQRVRRGRRAIRVMVRRSNGKRLVPVRGARIHLAGARARTNRRGFAIVRKRFIALGARRVLALHRDYRRGRSFMYVVR